MNSVIQILKSKSARLKKVAKVNANGVVDKKLHISLTEGLEHLRKSSGVFCAAPSVEYSACWIRDQLYANFAYYYMGDHEKFITGVQVVFDILHKFREKIEWAICHPPQAGHEFIHAKFDSDTYDEITKEWGHHQIDAMGLFLYIVAFAKKRDIGVIRDAKDLEMLQLLVAYLTSVRYWELPDNGMWEEEMDLHTSSIGACVRGLSAIKEQELAVVPETLIQEGLLSLYRLLPNETNTREQDMAQLSLIWPYRVIADDMSDIVLNRIEKNLVQERGLNRYLDDNYYRSENGVSAEWTMGFFWLSIIYTEKGNEEKALYWLERGIKTITDDGFLPELYCDERPNPNTPLAWSHSLALIAAKKLEKFV